MRLVRRVSLTLLGLCLTAAALAQPRVRMNIDDPRFDLDGYKIAVQVLKDRDKDPNHHDDPVNWINNGYTYFANLHDFFDGSNSGCIHGSEVFLPWHRELLYRYEMAIRAAKPGRTDNLTIPYWDWSQPPSGSSYPKAFEDKSSVLFSATRNMPISGHYDANEIDTMIGDTQDWTIFAGDPCSLKPNCGPGQNCAKCPSFKFGALEDPFHNNMHGWCGPPMEDPTTAVEDPIFWSFHAFIDHIYARWQCAHQKLPVCMDCNFRGMTDSKVRDVVDIERQLGYLYDNVPSCMPEAASTAALMMAAPQARSMSTAESASPRTKERHIPLALHVEKTKKKAAAPAPSNLGPYIYDLPLPAANFQTAHVDISGLPVPTTFSYSGKVYLYPPDAQFKPGDADFTRRYRVRDFGVWARPPEKGGEHADHGGEAPTAVITVDVTHALRFLAQTEYGAVWRVAIMFDPPRPISSYLKSGAVTAASASQELHFSSVELVLDETKE